MTRTLPQRARGAVLGAIFGDCLGAEFEYAWRAVPVENVISYFESIQKKAQNKEMGKGQALYTDDSCMTFDLGLSLVKHKEFNPQDVARNFSETFFASSSQRFYGGNVTTVFRELKKVNYCGDVYEPATRQFNGSGSYGNGSAMRVSPVPLFHHNNINGIVKLAGEQSKITHTNPLGVNGAILQALAIEKAMNAEEITDPAMFCQELVQQLKEVSPTSDGLDVYEEKMNKVIKFLQSDELVKESQVNTEIGSGVTAQAAIPAAIFSFLYCLDKNRIPSLSEFNGLLRTAIYAVAFSYDSDTVGSMACAIAGAYYGVDCIPEEWKCVCEGADAALKLADDLIQINQSEKSGEEI